MAVPMGLVSGFSAPGPATASAIESPPWLVLAQSGGPTAGVNASLVGAIRKARESGRVARVWGARFGFEGILAEDWLDLSGLGAADLASFRGTPGAGLGSSRHRPT